MADKKVENIIKNRLQNFESDAPSDAWSAIEAGMTNATSVPFYKKPWIIISAVVLLLSSLIVLRAIDPFKGNESTGEVISQENVERSEELIVNDKGGVITKKNWERVGSTNRSS